MTFLTLKLASTSGTTRTNRSIRVPVSPASRAKRAVPTATIPNNGDNKQSIKLTMKVAPSKLREVMRANELDALKDTLGGGTVLDAPRSSRRAAQARSPGRPSSRSKYVAPRESDIEDDEDDEDDAEAEEDTTMNDFDEVGAEAEGGTDDDMDVDESPAPSALPKKNQFPPKPPKITLKTPSKKDSKQPAKPTVVVTPANVGPLQSVEDEEMEDEPDDDELDDSELPEETNLEDDEDVEAEDDDEELEETNLNDEDGANEELEGDEDDDLDDSDEEPASGSVTPDLSKLTARQRGKASEPLMSLDMAPQQRKFFTDAEKAMKKDEHARKRKELTKRKTQEEKTAALNRLVRHIFAILYVR